MNIAIAFVNCKIKSLTVARQKLILLYKLFSLNDILSMEMIKLNWL
jgi:hypothetical protein